MDDDVDSLLLELDSPPILEQVSPSLSSPGLETKVGVRFSAWISFSLTAR